MDACIDFSRLNSTATQWPLPRSLYLVFADVNSPELKCTPNYPPGCFTDGMEGGGRGAATAPTKRLIIFF